MVHRRRRIISDVLREEVDRYYLGLSKVLCVIHESMFLLHYPFSKVYSLYFKLFGRAFSVPVIVFRLSSSLWIVLKFVLVCPGRTVTVNFRSSPFAPPTPASIIPIFLRNPYFQFLP